MVKLYRDDQARLSIDIRDTGAGFVPEELIRALDGSREASDDQRYTQSGLGLILTRKYLDLVGALLTISSSPGKGSVFTVTLPASMEIGGETREEGQSSPANASKEPAGPVEPAGPAGARPTIVVVEDQPDQALFMRAVLQSRYTVVLAADAAQAVMRLEELGERVRLILMDVLLGGGEDGLSLTRRLRADRRWKHLPVVVTTAHAFEEDRERALAAGCTAYLAKPINAAQLVATIERLVG